jgi:hypothetical protein
MQSEKEGSMRRPIPVFCLAMCCAFAIQAVWAVDEPYGQNTLPRLTQTADLVVRTADSKVVERTDSAPRMVLIVTHVKEVLAGKSKVDVKEFRIQIPAAVFPAQGINAGTILFLVAVDDPTRKHLAPYEIVGSRGIISPMESPRYGPTLEYLSTSSLGGKLEWAVRYLHHGDPFLQRSAVVQAGELAADPKSAEAPKGFDLLHTALTSSNVLNSSKVAALQSLAQLQSEKATGIVAGFVENEKMAWPLRREAMGYMIGMPSGRKHLEQWTATNTGLAKEAKLILESAKSKEKESAPPKTNRTRPERKGLREGTGDGLAASLDAVHKAAALDRMDASSALEAIARDAGQPEVARHCAILAIAGMEGTDSRTLLQKLGRTLTEPSLRALANGLSLD